MTNDLKRFNELFPNSKYREVHAQYTGETESPEGKDAYQKSKAPLNNKVLTFDEIKATQNRIGWIVPKEYIVIDIDDQTDAKAVFRLLNARQVRYSYMRGKKGAHFIFKNVRGVKSISAGQTCSLGITVDVRCNEKGYIVLPENDTDRKWGELVDNLDDVPFFLVPQKNLKKPDLPFLGMGEGSGRNDALLRFMLSLIDYAKDLTITEKADSIRIINKHFFKQPLTDDELNKTVLRDDILKRDDTPKQEKRCYEERLAVKILKDKKIINSADTFYMFNGRYYKPLRDNTELERIIHAEYNPNLKSTQRAEVIRFMKLKCLVDPSELNKTWRDIVFKNGVLNLSTMELRPHSDAEYNTTYINYNYYETPEYSPMIDNFMNSLCGNDENTKTLLYEIIGNCLLRKNLFSKFFLCYGQGGTGKSSFLKLIGKILGEENVAYLALNDLEEQFMPINLYGKLANLGDDIPYYIKETANLKKLVTGEDFEAQVKHKESVHFSNFATFVFTTNKLPDVLDRSSGFYRRFMIVEMNNKIDSPDSLYFERLTEQDYEYAISLAIEKLLAAIKRGKLTESADSLVKLEEYRTEQSSVLMFLKEFQYNRDTLKYRPCMDVFKEYEGYCKEVGYKSLKKVNFDRELCEELRMTKRNTTWKEDKTANQCWRFV